jgi:hypothetical protein
MRRRQSRTPRSAASRRGASNLTLTESFWTATRGYDDPVDGQGLSLAMCDVRQLSELLLATGDGTLAGLGPYGVLRSAPRIATGRTSIAHESRLTEPPDCTAPGRSHLAGSAAQNRAICMDEAHDHLLRALRVLGDVLAGVGHVEVVEGGVGAGHARLARDVLLVDVGRERVRPPRRRCGYRASRTPSGRAVTRATPFRAVSRPALRRRRKSLPGTSACVLLSIRGGGAEGRRRCCVVGVELEHGPVAYAQLADLAADRDRD